MIGKTLSTTARAFSSLLALLGPLAACGGCSSPSPSSVGQESGSSSGAFPADAAAASRDAGSPDAAAATAVVQVSVQGQIDGKPFTALGVAAREFGWVTKSGDPGPGLAFAIGDYPSMCTAACATGKQAIQFFLRANGKAFEPFPTGAYPIVADAVVGGAGPAPQGSVLTTKLVEGCDLTLPEATTGSVTITSSSATSATGTFEVISPTNGTLRGSFIVPICPFADVVQCARGNQSTSTNSIVCSL